MNSDEVLAELDAQYQELIQSVQLEGLSQDENSEQSGQKQIEAVRNRRLENVGEIIRKYEQTLQTSREFYEGEIKKLEDTKSKTEAKYIESKKQIKVFENKIAQISENHQIQINTINEQKDTEIKALKDELLKKAEEFNKLTQEHSKSLLNERMLDSLQKEKTELVNKYEQLTVEMKELETEFTEQKEMLSEKKMSLEKYKVEIIQTRQLMDEQQIEYQDLQKQLKGAREEINFLCTTNEDLIEQNDKLTKKLEKYQPANSLLNSMILGDDKSEISTIINNNNNNKPLPPPNEEEDEEKQNKKEEQVKQDDNQQVPSLIADDESMSVFNVDEANANLNMSLGGDRLDCPKLQTSSSMFVIESVENTKIKEEMQRLEQDFNHQYQTVVNEKQELSTRIKDLEETIQSLSHKLAESIAMKTPEGDQGTEQKPNFDTDTMFKFQEEYERMMNQQKEEYDRMMNEQKEEYEMKIMQIMDENLSKQNKLTQLTEKAKKLEFEKNQAIDKNNENNYNQKNESSVKMREILKEKDNKIAELNLAFKILESEQNDNNANLEKTINSYQSKSQQSEMTINRLRERHEKLSADYRELQSKYHDVKMGVNDYKSNEQDYKSEIQGLQLNLKFATTELEQKKLELESQRKLTTKQAADITQLNHDIKQLYVEGEALRSQSIQSQQLIQSLEKRIITQQQHLHHARNQLQMQMALNMQHLQTMSTLSDNNNNKKNDYMTQNIPQIDHNATPPIPTAQKSYISHMLQPQQQQQLMQKLLLIQNQQNQQNKENKNNKNIFMNQATINNQPRISLPQATQSPQPIQQFNITQPIPQTPQQQQNVNKIVNMRNNQSKVLLPGQVPNDLMNLARGKPFNASTSFSNGSRNNNGSRSIPLNGDISNPMSKNKLNFLLQQRQKLESQLFKLPTQPRSLEQRKRKQSLEQAVMSIEQQIEAIKKK